MKKAAPKDGLVVSYSECMAGIHNPPLRPGIAGVRVGITANSGMEMRSNQDPKDVRDDAFKSWMDENLPNWNDGAGDAEATRSMNFINRAFKAGWSAAVKWANATSS